MISQKRLKKTPQLIFGLIAICLLLFSTYQTALGYEKLAGGQVKSWFISAVLSLSLLGIAIYIHQKRYSVFLLFLLYLSVASISLLANFNAFYTQNNKLEIITNKADNLNNDFNELLSKTELEFQNKNKVVELEQLVKVKRDQLVLQILDPNNKGYGIRAKSITKDIEELLGVEMTEPSGTPKEIAGFMANQIEVVLDSRLLSIDNGYKAFIKDFKLEKERFNKNLDSIKIINDYESYKKLVSSGLKKYNLYGIMAKEFVENKTFFTPKTDEVSVIGTIEYSVRHGKNNRNNGLTSLLFAAFIDFFIPFLLLIEILAEKKSKSLTTVFASRKNTKYSNGSIIDNKTKKRGVKN